VGHRLDTESFTRDFTENAKPIFALKKGKTEKGRLAALQSVINQKLET